MPTVIDSLIVTLGLDPAKFKQGSKETGESLDKTREHAEKTGKDMELRGKQAAQFFAKIKNEVVGLMGAFLGTRAIANFIGNVTTADAALGRLGTNVGMAVDELSAWQGSVEKTGGSAAAFAGTVRGISKGIQDFYMTGNSHLIPFLSAAGVNLSKFFDKTTPMTERLKMIADAFKKMSAPQAQAFGANLGLDEGTINLLMRGRTAVDDLLESQRQLNIATQKDVELATAREQAWKRMLDRIEQAGRSILNSPLVEKVSNKLMQLGGDAVQGYSYLANLLSDKTIDMRDGLKGTGTIIGKREGNTIIRHKPNAIPPGMDDVRLNDSSGSRGDRNNNPGNLNYAGQAGATKESGAGGRFAVFESTVAGIAAMQRQLALYSARGLDTVRAIVEKYAPAKDNNNTEAYIKKIAAKLKVKDNDKLDLSNKTTMRDLITAMIEQEGNHANIDQINEGMDLYSRSRAGANITPTGNKTDVRIGNVNVYMPPGSDAKAIANEIGPAIEQAAFPSQANSGLR